MKAQVSIIAAVLLAAAVWPTAAAPGPATATPATPTTAPVTKPVPATAAQPRSAATKQEEALLAQSVIALKAKKWQDAVTPLTKLVALNPRWEFYQSLGDAQAGLAKYTEAVAAYDKALLGAKADKVTPAETRRAALVKMLIDKGNALLSLDRKDDALAAFAEMAPLAPKPAVAYFQLCFTAYNIGNLKVVVSACDQAIKADPKKADAYFLKGSALYDSGTASPAGKRVVPAGTIEALKKYLELLPNGPLAENVRGMLATAVPKPA